MNAQDGIVNGVSEVGGTVTGSLGGLFNSIQEGVGQYGLKIGRYNSLNNWSLDCKGCSKSG